MRLQPFTRQHLLQATQSTTRSVRPANTISPPWEGASQFPPLEAPCCAELTLTTVITPDTLKWHFDDGKWRKGDGPGADGVRLSGVSESEAWDICHALADEVARGLWTPHAPRIQQVKKRDGTDRDLQIRDAFDRIVSAAVAKSAWSLIKPRIPRYVASVHGGVHQVLLLIKCAAAEMGYFAIAPDDIQKAFDNVPVADSVRDFARYIIDPPLLDLIERILRGHRSPQSNPVGLAQGDALSSPAMELRLFHVLDLPEQSGRRVFPLSVRFVDNVFKIGSSVSSVTDALAEDERRLGQAGLHLKHTDGPPRDIREAPVDLLGFRVVAIQNQVQFQLQPNAYDCLRENLEEAHQRQNPRDSARRKILGWISSHGPVMGDADKSQVISHIRRIASQSGFTGILANQEIRHMIDRAAQRWSQVAQGASLTRLLGDNWG